MKKRYALFINQTQILIADSLQEVQSELRMRKLFTEDFHNSLMERFSVREYNSIVAEVCSKFNILSTEISSKYRESVASAVDGVMFERAVSYTLADKKDFELGNIGVREVASPGRVRDIPGSIVCEMADSVKSILRRKCPELSADVLYSERGEDLQIIITDPSVLSFRLTKKTTIFSSEIKTKQHEDSLPSRV